MAKDTNTLQNEMNQSSTDVVSRVRAGVQSRVETVKGTVGDTAGNVRDAVGAIDVPDSGRRAFAFARENPIGLALVGLAVGFLVGSLLPISDTERERLGPIRDRVVDQAQAATQDLMNAGRAVVAETAQNVVQSAQGVVDTAVSSAQTHGQEVVDAARARNDNG